MENTNHDETLLARWLSDELTEHELAELQLREDFAELQAIVEGMKGLDMPAFSEQASWEKLQQKLTAEPPKTALPQTPNTAILDGEKEIAEVIATAVAVIPKTTDPVISEGKITNPEKEEADALLPTLAVSERKTALEMPEAEAVEIITANPVANTAAPSPTPPTLTPVVATPVRSINRRKWLYAAAAAVALLLVTFLWLKKPNDPSTGYDTAIATKPGQQTQAKLPDGSTAELNALTTIAFTDADWADDREVYLKGEAYFKAKKGKTFTVLTDQGTVKVVGTMFNVYARDNTLEVKCTEGTVQVLNPVGSEKVLIKKGEQVSVVNGKMQRRAGIDFTPKWFAGESVFRSATRRRVFGEIERQFGVKVVGEGLEGSPFSGKFVNSDLDKALRMVSVPMGLQYEVRNDTVWFSQK